MGTIKNTKRHMPLFGGIRIRWTLLDYIGYFLIALTYFLSYIIVNNSHEMIIFMALTMTIGIVTIFKTRFKLKIWVHGYYGYIILFALFCYLSSFWALSPRITIGKGNTIIEIFLLMIVIGMFVRENMDPIDFLLKVFMWGGVCVVLYGISYYGISGLRTAFESESRLDNSLININNLGMCAAYSIIICVYYMLYDRLRFWNVILIPNILMVAASGSRKAILMVILGIFMIIIMKNLNNKNMLRVALKILLITILLSVLTWIIIQLPIFADIRKRMLSLFIAMSGNNNQADNSALTRFQLVEIGKEIFQKHKLLGIGIDNARIITKQLIGKDNYYLHNNYIELLADGGIIGFTLYYSVYLYFFIKFLKIREFKDGQYVICVTLFIINLLIEYGAVTYVYKHTYMYLMMFFLYCETQNLKSKHLNRIIQY